MDSVLDVIRKEAENTDCLQVTKVRLNLIFGTENTFVELRTVSKVINIICRTEHDCLQVSKV